MKRSPKIDLSTRKNEILENMIAARESILAEVDRLQPEQIQVKYLGSWSVLELLAHLSGWDETNRAAVQSLSKAQLPDFYNHRDPDWRSYNAILVDRFMIDDLPSMISAAKESFMRLVQLVEGIDPKDLDRDWGVRYKGYRVTIARLLESEARDEQEHARQLSGFFTPQSQGG